MIFFSFDFLAFFHFLHSSVVRPQPMHQPVFLSNLQMSMQGDFKL